jgi:hypothetical protein
LNQLIPVERRNFEYAAWGIVLLVLVHLCWLQLRPESGWHRIHAVATKSAASRAAGMPEEQWGKIAGPAGNGNGLLKLAGYAKTNLAVENHLSFFYHWTSYALYPRRLYVAPPDTVINKGRDIMQAAFNPDRQWLQQHDVRFVLMFGNDKPGGETPRLEILPPIDGEDGMQTNRSGGK